MPCGSSKHQKPQSIIQSIEKPSEDGVNDVSSNSRKHQGGNDVTDSEMLNHKNGGFVIAESVQQNNEETSNVKKRKCKGCFRNTKSSRTLRQASTSRELVLCKYSNQQRMELSQKLWLPIEIDSHVSASNLSNGFYRQTTSNSWFSNETWNHDTRNRNSSTTFYPSLRCLPAADMAVGDTEKERTASLLKPRTSKKKSTPKEAKEKKYPTQKPGWIAEHLYSCDECPARYKTSGSLKGHKTKKHSGVVKDTKPSVNACRIFGVFVDPTTKQHLNRLFGIARSVYNVGVDLANRTKVTDATWLMGFATEDKLPERWMNVLPIQCRKLALRDAATAVSEANKTGGHVKYRSRKSGSVIEYENHLNKTGTYKIRAVPINGTNKRYRLLVGDDLNKTLKKAAGLLPTITFGQKVRHERRRQHKAKRRKLQGKGRGVKKRKRTLKTPGLIVSSKAAKFINTMCDRQPKLIMTKTGKFQIHIPFSSPQKSFPAADEPRKIASLDTGVRTFQGVWSPDGSGYKLGVSGKSEYGRGCADELLRRTLGACRVEGLAQDKSRPYRQRRRLWQKSTRLRTRIKHLVDELHYKTIRFLTTRYDVIVIPPFETAKMSRRFDAATRKRRIIRKKSVRQMGILSHYKFRQRLQSVAKRVGVEVMVMTEEYTTKTCGLCHTLHPKVGGSKMYKCVNPSCGIQYDRDVGGGARNIFIKNVDVLSDLNV